MLPNWMPMTEEWPFSATFRKGLTGQKIQWRQDIQNNKVEIGRSFPKQSNNLSDENYV
jgi:hypothetical protein